MNNPKLLTLVFLCVLVGLAGCDTTDQPAQVTVHVDDRSVEGEQVQLDGNVTLTGRSHNVTLQQVQLRFVAANGTTIQTIPIGTMSAPAGWGFVRVEYNTTVAEPPEELRLQIGTVDKPPDADLIVQGRRLVDAGELRYTELTQDEY
jgi:hypothetical protein